MGLALVGSNNGKWIVPTAGRGRELIALVTRAYELL